MKVLGEDGLIIIKDKINDITQLGSNIILDPSSPLNESIGLSYSLNSSPIVFIKDTYIEYSKLGFGGPKFIKRMGTIGALILKFTHADASVTLPHFGGAFGDAFNNANEGDVYYTSPSYATINYSTFFPVQFTGSASEKVNIPVMLTYWYDQSNTTNCIAPFGHGFISNNITFAKILPGQPIVDRLGVIFKDKETHNGPIPVVFPGSYFSEMLECLSYFHIGMISEIMSRPVRVMRMKSSKQYRNMVSIID